MVKKLKEDFSGLEKKHLLLIVDYLSAWNKQFIFLIFFIAVAFALIVYDFYSSFFGIIDAGLQQAILAMVVLTALLLIFSQYQRMVLEKKIKKDLE
ncbi:MAG: hypothetical protein ABH821_04740 [archaeon]